MERLREEVGSEQVSEKYRQKTKDFTRKRRLDFAKVVILMLSGHKFSLQNAVNKFFSGIGQVFEMPTASAYCQARQKVKAEVFVHLNEVLVKDFYQLYEEEGEVLRWHGHRLLGADGTRLNVPENEETKKVFSLHRNHKPAPESARLQGLGIVRYDLLNDFGLRGALTKAHYGENALMFEALWSATQAGDVLVLDRGKASYYLMSKAIQEKRELIVRMPRGKYQIVTDFLASDKTDAVVKLRVGPRTTTARQVKVEN